LYERWLILLSELLKEEYIQLDMFVENFDEAIKVSAQPLLIDDAIEKEYISSIVSIYHEIGPYIVITKQIALPHAPIEKGAKKLALGFTRLSRPVISGHESNDPVKFLFPLSSPDHESHIALLSELAELLDNKAFLELLGTMTTKKELIAFLKKFEGENNYA
jgi:PTS system ascorbate-specific IIA component